MRILKLILLMALMLPLAGAAPRAIADTEVPASVAPGDPPEEAERMSGQLEIVNPAQGSVTLAGVVYHVPKEVNDLSGFRAGDIVEVLYLPGSNNVLAIHREELG